MAGIYSSILPHQTRLICLPREPEAKSTEPITCSLIVADMLHPIFEGFGLRCHNREDERVVSFNAVSYAWGSAEKTASIVCNGINVPVTETLHEALVAMRSLDLETDYLWVDALCINQDDGHEKAIQVSHMFQIFQQAAHTIAWLGDPSEQGPDVMIATSVDLPSGNEQEESTESTSAIDFARFTVGAEWIYTRPWFQRIWVQQEVFASRSLRLLCGSHIIKSCLLLSPTALEKWLPRDNLEFVVQTGNIFRRKTRKEVHQMIRDDVAPLNSIINHASVHLGSYIHFIRRERTDMIECMLRTSDTQTTDPRDYVFGLLGIAKFPAKPLSVEAWFQAQDRDSFIPIDYTADMDIIWCILTRVLLFKAGLGLLARFKINKRDEIDGKGRQLPSWVIDWRYAAQAVQWSDTPFFEERTLDNIWHAQVRKRFDTELERGYDGRNYSLGPGQAPRPHREFCNSNMNVCQTDLTRLTIHGRVVDPKYVQLVGNVVSVQSNRKQAPAQWHVPAGVHHDDIVAEFPALKWDPLWLLRPQGNTEFKLVACLRASTLRLHPYESWVHKDEILQDESKWLPLQVYSQKANDWNDEAPAITPRFGEMTTFVIV